MSDHREKVEEAANRIRRELMATLAELDRRRDRALDPRYQLQQHATALFVVGAGLALFVGAASGWGVYRRQTRARRLRQQRWRGIRRAWAHPDRLATGPKRRPRAIKILRRLLVTIALGLGAQVGRRISARPARRLPTASRSRLPQLPH